jgi:hypothetical protein
MKSKSSNLDMNQVFDSLAKITQADPKMDLYSGVMERIEFQNKIPISRVASAAAVLVLFISTEFLYLNYSEKKNANQSQLMSLMPQGDNPLYHE